jgi:enamine deaminase RidA (YjgF/YER057c/UK114 family)
VKVRIFLTTMDDYEGMNRAYAKYFEGYDYPARFGLSVLALPA